MPLLLEVVTAANGYVLYAVAIGLLTCLGAGLAGHLAAKEPWHKWLFWGSGFIIVILIYFQARAYKEPPSASEIASAVVNKLSEQHNVQESNSVPSRTVSENRGSHRSPKNHKPIVRKLPKSVPAENQPSMLAHLSATQSEKISTRLDAPFETEVIIQTDKTFPALKLLMQCDKPLLDAHATISQTSGMVQMMVSSGIVRDHPNVVVYSYGSSTPPFGPANPLIIDVWSKKSVTCKQIATF